MTTDDDVQRAAEEKRIDDLRRWGREAVARPDPILFLIAVPTDVQRDALVDQMIRAMEVV